jgi:hypothetical protein
MRGLLCCCLITGGAALAWPCAAQSRETLETRVTARNGAVFLKWGKKHPWDAQLQASGAILVAEYRTRAGAVALDCLDSPSTEPDGARGRRPAMPARRGCAGIPGKLEGDRDDRTLRFSLPASTTATPAGPVCLFFRLPNGRVLPIRRANKEREGTARFRYEPWEDAAKHQRDVAALEARVDGMRRAVAVMAQRIAAQESANDRDGWTSPEACQAIQAPDLGNAQRERPLAEPAEQEEIATRVCIMRVWYADSLLARLPLERKIAIGVVQPPAVLDQVFALLPGTAADQPSVPERQRQAEQYRGDWKRWAASVRHYRDGIVRDSFQLPHFGDFRDYLGLQSITTQAGERIAAQLARNERADPTDLAGWVGGSLEAYTRCVSDGKAQLATSYRNARELETRSPAVREGIRQTMIRACQSGLAKLAELRTEHARLVAELQQAEAALSAAQRPPSLPDRQVELNTAVCEP